MALPRAHSAGVQPYRAPRVPASLPALFTVERADFSGTIVDLSRSGAQVEAAEDRVPMPGTPIRLFIRGGRESQIAVDARVVRHTGRGFGAQFSEPTPVELLELLAALGA